MCTFGATSTTTSDRRSRVVAMMRTRARLRTRVAKAASLAVAATAALGVGSCTSAPIRTVPRRSDGSMTRGNQVRAAELLGINRNTLRKKIRELGIDVLRAPSR